MNDLLSNMSDTHVHMEARLLLNYNWYLYENNSMRHILSHTRIYIFDLPSEIMTTGSSQTAQKES
jgi:hypothetical protein